MLKAKGTARFADNRPGSAELTRQMKMIQRKPEDEMLQKKTEDDMLQRKPEDELLQKKPEDELLQKKPEDEMLQRKTEDELLQKKTDEEMLQPKTEDELPVQKKSIDEEPLQKVSSGKGANNNGLPDKLRSGVENLSGIAMDDVKVHYNSSRPAQLNALAYAQGSDIHLAPGQEKHLPHEAWHVVQQKQGRVQPTMQMKAGVPVNDDPGLEKEADIKGAQSLQMKCKECEESPAQRVTASHASRGVAQRYTEQKGWKISETDGYKIEKRVPSRLHVKHGMPGPHPADKFAVVGSANGYDMYTFSGRFVNDCLGFSEYLSTGKYSKASAFVGKDDDPSGTDREFGKSDKQNLSIAESGGSSKFSKGTDATPGIGESYTMVRRKIEANECPFHVAMVVASDGEDNVTCEADAGANRRKPIFDMYVAHAKKKRKTGDVPLTFHETYKSAYTTKDNISPTTGVLAPKPVI